MKKKNTQESDDERWSRLDKRIERARAIHELARIVIKIHHRWILQYFCWFNSFKKTCKNL